MRDFDKWLLQFRNSIAGYDYYVDFKKVVANVESCRAELHLLDSLIGCDNVEEAFRILVVKYPSVIPVVPILLAVRGTEIYAKDGISGGLYRFDGKSHTIDEYCVFMRKTGLFDMISHRLLKSMYDYVLGVETGLDSNGRKNRGGHQMENLVESYLKQAGLEYYKEMYASELNKKWGVDVSALTNAGKAKKRFDFVVHTKNTVYAIETNFYTGGGSKLNETARSYKMLAYEAKEIKNFKFVWFTDGAGWNSARQNLRETFEVLPDMYNIKELEDGIATSIFV